MTRLADLDLLVYTEACLIDYLTFRWNTFRSPVYLHVFTGVFIHIHKYTGIYTLDLAFSMYLTTLFRWNTIMWNTIRE